MSGLICYEDYLDDALTKSVLSEDPLFPASNLYDQGIRGRVYRSAGFFVVDASNNQIVLQEGPIFSDTLVTIPQDTTYESIDEFLAAVKAAFEAVSSDTYSVTRDPQTLRIKIQRLSLETFNLMWTDPDSTAYDLLGFSNLADDTVPTADVAGDYYLSDNIRNHSFERIAWDLGASSNPDVLILIGKKNQAIKISESATITLRGYLEQGDPPSYEETLEYNELAIMKLKDLTADGLHTSALRYWTLEIIDRENANGYIEISKIFLGKYYTPTRARIQFPFSVASVDFSVSNQLQYGAKTYTKRQKTERFDFNWLPLDVTEKEQFDEVFRVCGTSRPFFMIFDTDNCIGSSTGYSTRYVCFAQDPAISLERPNIWESGWTLEEQI